MSTDYSSQSPCWNKEDRFALSQSVQMRLINPYVTKTEDAARILHNKLILFVFPIHDLVVFAT